jgi:CubicO group peptidase (beta-lactamase class C family)
VRSDRASWQELLDSAARARRVPGASLAVLADGEVHAVATGVLHRGTGVEATTDSLFQIGSITKAWTATMVMQLIADGALSLDTPVAAMIPELRSASPTVVGGVTVRDLLSHTSGIDGDIFVDTGRGDDCLERYVQQLAAAARLHPIGATFSYCNSGYVLAGRLIETVTGQVWDTVLRERIIEPLGLTHTVTLPEDVLRYRSAIGHLGHDPEPAGVWGLPRSGGPAGLICATAADVIAFARMHLDGGSGPDGEVVLRPDLVRLMQQPAATVPRSTGKVGHWGLGWALNDWPGGPLYGHDGATIGQSAFIRISPAHHVAVALVANGGDTAGLFDDLYGPLLADLCHITVPTFTPPADPPAVDGSEHAGVYQRSSVQVTVTTTGHGLHGRIERTGELASINPSLDIDLTPVTADIWAYQPDPGAPWEAWRFYQLDDGTPYLHAGLRATPKIT